MSVILYPPIHIKMEEYQDYFDDGPVNNQKSGAKKSKNNNQQNKKKTKKKKNTGKNKTYTSKHVRKVERQFEKLKTS